MSAMLRRNLLICVLLLLFSLAPRPAHSQITNLDFGNVAVGQPKDQVLTKTLYLSGYTSANINTPYFTGPDKADFKITQDGFTGGPYSNGAMLSVTIEFTPSRTGPEQATLDGSGTVQPGNAPLSFIPVTLTGTGVAPVTVNVTLPAIDIPFDADVAYHADALPLTFTVALQANPLLFHAVSNTGVLSGSLSVVSIPIYFRSSTIATIDAYPPGSLSGLPTRSISGGVVTNGSLLNGPFNSSHYYFEWQSPGFSVSAISGTISLDRVFPVQPLTYWVDLDNLGLSPNTASTATIIQGAESYLHTELTRYYVLPQMIGAIPISGDDIVVYSDKQQYTRSSNITRRTIVLFNRSSRTFEGPIQLVPAFSTGVNLFYHFTPDPPQTAILAAGLASPYFTADIGTFPPATFATISLKYVGQPISVSFTPYFYSGTFLY